MIPLNPDKNNSKSASPAPHPIIPAPVSSIHPSQPSLVKKLFDQPSYAQRKATRTQMGLALLEKGKGWPHLGSKSWLRQFALQACFKGIRDTSFEGGSTIDSADAAILFIELCKKGEALFFPLDAFPVSYFEVIAAHLKVYREFLEILAPSSKHDVLTKQDVEGRAARVLEKIRFEFVQKKQKMIYIPLGYRQGIKNQGHTIACKLVDEEAHVVVSLFNLGNGSECHPNLEHGLNQQKKSYSFFPIRISKEIFYETYGLEIFCRIIRYLNDRPVTECEYRGRDLYDLFLQFTVFNGCAEVAADLGPNGHLLAEQTQISGNCPEVALSCVLKDICIHLGAEDRTIQRLFINRNLCALITAYHCMERESHESAAADLLQEAAQSFADLILAAHEQTVVTREELIVAQAVEHQLIKRARCVLLQAKQSATQAPALGEAGRETSVAFPLVPSLKEASARKSVQSKPRAPFFDPTVPLRLTAPRFDGANMDRFSALLADIVKKSGSLSPTDVFAFVSDWVETFPIPRRAISRQKIDNALSKELSFQRDVEPPISDVWHTVPLEHIPSILQNLKILLQKGLQHVKIPDLSDPNLSDSQLLFSFESYAASDASFTSLFLTLYSVLAIADTLARRCQENFLDGYATPFLPPFFDCSPRGFSSLPFGKENQRYSQLLAYFEGREYFIDHGDREKVIFPIAPILEIETFVKRLIEKRGGERHILQGVYHVEYLSRFMRSEALGSSEEARASVLQQNWMQALPISIQHLYYFVYLSQCLFLCPGSSFPQEMRCAPIDTAGKRGLKLEGPFYEKDAQTLSPYLKEGSLQIDRMVTDPRLFQNGLYVKLHQEQTSPFVDLFSEEIRKMDTNQAICSNLSERQQRLWRISERDYRTILYMLRKPNLRFWQAIEVFSSPENRHLLSHLGVQQAVDICLFQPRFLIQRLECEPEMTTRAFRDFVEKSLVFFENSIHHFDAIAFVLRSAIYFETYTQPSLDQANALERYEKAIHDLLKLPLSGAQKNELVHYKILLQTIQILKDPTELFVNLFQLVVDSAPVPRKEPGLRLHFYKQVRLSAYRYEALFQNPSMRNKICRAILEKAAGVGVPETAQQEWGGEFPRYECGDWVIDLLHGTIFHQRNRGFLCNKAHDKMHEGIFNLTFENRQRIFSQYGSLFWHCADGALISLSGKLRYDPIAGLWRESVLGAGGKFIEQTMHLFSLEKAEAGGQGFLASFRQLPWIHYQEDGGVITTYDFKTKRPYMRICQSKSSHTWEYTRLSESGKELSHYKLANLQNIQQGDPLFAYTRFASSNHILCFVNTQAPVGSQPIEELHFFHLQLLFKQDGKGLASQEYPGFYLIANENDCRFKESFAQTAREHNRVLAQIHNLSFALVLYNPASQKWMVILPQNDVKLRSQDFSREIEVSVGLQESKYSLYACDPSAETLVALGSDTNQAYLYLAFIFKMIREYEKSYKYIKKVNFLNKLSYSDFSVLNKFVDLDHDSSLFSTVFNLKLFLLILNNSNLMFESYFADRASSSHDKGMRRFLNWAIQNYRHYLHLTTDANFNRTPDLLQLTEGEKKVILFALRNHYKDLYASHPQGWESVWKTDLPVLEGQYQIYFSSERENTFHLNPQHISICPSAFEAVLMPHRINQSIFLNWAIRSSSSYTQRVSFSDYPVLLTQETLQAQFVELYETARRCRPGRLDPFDFTLQAIVKVKPKELSPDLGSILFWVRHFSDCFNDLKLSSAEFKKDCQEIIKRIQALTQLPRYEAFVQGFLKKELVFTCERPFHISAAIEQPRSMPLKLRFEEVSSKEELQTQIRRIFRSPYKAMNEPLGPEETELETRFILRKDCAKSIHIPAKRLDDFDEIPEAIMKHVILPNNVDWLLKRRPMLSEAMAMRLCSLVNQWYFIRLQAKLKEMNVQPAQYDPCEFPEITYFSLMTGKIPRPSQIATYLWIREGLSQGKPRYFQLAAGDGKTDVIVPLMHLAAKRMGLMPVTCVTQAIYPVDKENLGFNLRSLNENLCYLELGMHMIQSLTAEHLEFILAQLSQYKREGKSLIITRHTIDALRLVLELACYQPIDQRAESTRRQKILFAQDILNFFSHRCLLICDEAHQNGDPLTRAIFGAGEFVPIPQEESDYLLELMKPLLSGYEKAVYEMDRAQNAPSEASVKSLQRDLAQGYLASHFPMIVEPKAQREFLDYWTDSNAPQPKLMKQWGESKEPQARLLANRSALTGHFLVSLFPEIVQMRTGVDHCRSLYPQRKYEVPAHNKLPSTAEYEDPYKTAALTIKGTYSRGLSFEDFKEFLLDLLTESAQEQRSGVIALQTRANQLLTSWVLGMPTLKGIVLEKISFSNAQLMGDLFHALSKKASVIESFLKRYSFQAIGAPSARLTSTTTEVFHTFRSKVLFSATPLDALANPYAIQPSDYRLDSQFKDNVKRKLLEGTNGQKIFIDRIDRFFTQMKTENLAIFESASVLIDPRGFFSDYTNQALAQAWMEHNPKLDGVLFWQEAREIHVNRDERVCLLMKGGERFELKGSDMQACFTQIGLDWSQLHIGTIYDPARTESANIKQKPNATALFFPLEGLSVSHLIQAVMRLRGFLNEGQKIVWVFSKELAKNIFSSPEKRIQEFLDWSERNEAIQTEKRSVVNAFQEIRFVIAQQARQEIAQTHESDETPGMEEVVAVYKKYEKGFVESSSKTPYEAFGDHERAKPSPEALLHFAQRLYRAFNYPIAYEDNQGARGEVEKIIARFSEKIKTIRVTSFDSKRQTDQHAMIEAQVERHQENQIPRPLAPLAANGQYGHFVIYDPKFIQRVAKSSANQVLQTKFFSPLLEFSENQIITGRVKDGDPHQCQVLKPIQFLLVLFGSNEQAIEPKLVLAESNEIVATALDRLVMCPDRIEGLEHTAIIITADGQLVQKGLKALAPRRGVAERFLESQSLIDLVIDTHLLQGKLVHPFQHRLKERIARVGWVEFKKLWGNILERLPNKEAAQTQTLEEWERDMAQPSSLSPALDDFSTLSLSQPHKKLLSSYARQPREEVKGAR